MSHTYQGGCQCGAVRFEADADIDDLIAGNCSRCGKLGLILTFVPEDRFTLLQGEDHQSEFLFNQHAIHHRFCKTCGVQSFARGVGKDGRVMVALNVRCFDGVDTATLHPKPIDCRAF